jgi:O-antigen ligase
MGFAAAGVCAYVGACGLPGFANAAIVLLSGAAVLAASFDPPTRRPGWTPIDVGVLLFVASMLLSTMTSVEPARSLRLSVPLLAGMVLFVLISGYLDVERIRSLYATLALVSLGLAARLLWVAWHDPQAGPVQWTARVETPLIVVRNDVAFFAIVLPLSLALVRDAVRSPLALLGGASALASVVTMVVYQSRGAVLTTLLAVGVWAASLRRRSSWALVGLSALLVLAIDGACGFPLLLRFRETWATRVAIWVAALRMFEDAPLLGNGPRSFGVLFEDYFTSPSFPKWIPADPRLTAWAHNLYLETLAEQGLVGLAALVVLLVVTLAAVRRVRRAPRPSALAAGAWAALLALCAEGAFEASFVRLWVVVLFFVVIGSISVLATAAETAGVGAAGLGGGHEG